MLYPLVAVLESPGASHVTGALFGRRRGPYHHRKASGLYQRVTPVGDGDFELIPYPPLSAGPQRSGVSGVAEHDPGAAPGAGEPGPALARVKGPVSADG
jgi:hypothetical protein